MPLSVSMVGRVHTKPVQLSSICMGTLMAPQINAGAVNPVCDSTACMFCPVQVSDHPTRWEALFNTACSCRNTPRSQRGVSLLKDDRSCAGGQHNRQVQDLLLGWWQGHVPMARHPPQGCRAQHLQLCVRDPQGELRKDGVCHCTSRSLPSRLRRRLVFSESPASCLVPLSVFPDRMEPIDRRQRSRGASALTDARVDR